MKCGCIVDYKKNGKFLVKQCERKASIQICVHQHVGHYPVGTGWYWIPICPFHLAERRTILMRADKGKVWKSTPKENRK